MIMNICFVTFLYGMMIPILFPLAWIQLFVLYVVERLMMYYSYQKPKNFDEKITRSSLKLISNATPLFLLMGI